jgi:resuscitation-promoting factor RpfA
MATRSDSPKGRSLMRIAAAGAVAIGATFAVAGTATAAPASVWDRLAQCESGGNWNTNTGNGFSGGLQFAGSTWRAYGGKGAAHQASRGQQIAVAERVLASQGWKAWPACSRKLGLR